MSSGTSKSYFAFGEKEFGGNGFFMENEGPTLLNLKMIYGSRDALAAPDEILLSESMANAFFGKENPVDKTLIMNQEWDVLVKGVYKDFPSNSSFYDVKFVGAWELYLNIYPWMKDLENSWGFIGFPIFVQKHPGQSFEQISSSIKNAIINNISHDKAQMNVKPEVFLHPMKKWRLYSQFENGVIVGGRIQYIRLFGIIGGFVMLLAIINFINLSTA